MIIEIEDDFSLGKMADCGQCFRAVCLPDGSYRFISRENVLNIREQAPHQFQVSCSEEAWEKFWRDYFDLSRTYSRIREDLLMQLSGEEETPFGQTPRGVSEGDAATEAARRQDSTDSVERCMPGPDVVSDAAVRFLTQAEQAGRGLRILRQDPWEMLITFILSQRKNIPAIRSAVEKLAMLYGHPVNEMLFTFPTPEELGRASEADLRAAGLGYRAPYVKDAADKVLSGELDLEALEKLDDESLFEKLMTVKGVGKKVANCICLFGFGRTSRAPVDVWIERAVSLCGGVDPFPAFGEYAGIMQQYAFYYMTHQKV